MRSRESAFREIQSQCSNILAFAWLRQSLLGSTGPLAGLEGSLTLPFPSCGVLFAASEPPIRLQVRQERQSSANDFLTSVGALFVHKPTVGSLTLANKGRCMMYRRTHDFPPTLITTSTTATGLSDCRSQKVNKRERESKIDEEMQREEESADGRLSETLAAKLSLALATHASGRGRGARNVSDEGWTVPVCRCFLPVAEMLLLGE
ncbi:unnamed protein product [Protopolystoma xenopodis]|uniref:Uncharacterized protein n=1 Tax=Protopolystoma xenopodis TaxID=117903 RepID=A0A448XJX3_9PLAT|nr:unnamed protein product [Protopolystoma xenopodis]